MGMAHLKQEHEVEKMSRQLKSKSAESSKRMLGMLLSAQAEAIVKATFVAWSDWTKQENFKRLKADSVRARSKGEETQRRMLSKMLGSQDGLLLKGVVSAWHELICVYKQQKMKAGLKNAHVKQTLSMLAGSQESVLLRVAFGGWRDM